MNFSKTTHKLLNLVLILISLFFIMNLSSTFSPIVDVILYLLIPFIFGTYFYYALRPLKYWLLKKTNKEKLSSILAILFFFLILGFLSFFVGIIVYDQATQLAGQLDFSAISTSNSTIYNWIDTYFPVEDLINNALSWFQNTAVDLSKQLPGLVSSIGNVGSQFVLAFLCFFYLMKDDQLLKDGFEHYLNKQEKQTRMEQRNVVKDIDQTLANYINGQLTVAIILGVLMFIGYLIIDVPYAFLLAVIALVTNLIPFIGPIIGVIPAVLVALTVDFSMVLKIIVAVVIIQQLESDLISPYIMGSKLDIHPFTVIVVVLVSINLFGIVGALIATPLYLSLKTIVLYFLRRKQSSKIKQTL